MTTMDDQACLSPGNTIAKSNPQRSVVSFEINGPVAAARPRTGTGIAHLGGRKTGAVPNENMIRIILVERMNLLREALATVLSAEDDLTVAASVGNIQEAVSAA